VSVPQNGAVESEPLVPTEFDVTLRRVAVGVAPDGIGETIFDEEQAPELMEVADGADAAVEFRRTLGMFATGVTVITTRVGDQAHGMTANAFMSVSLAPPLILISIDRRARLNGLLREGARYGVSVLEEHQSGLSDRFAGRTADGPEPVFEIVHDTPLVDGALAHLVARVVRSYWGGDHSLFLGRVEYVRYGDGRPLLFHCGRYERVVTDPHVFSALSDELLRPILAAGVECTFAQGDTLMRAGESGDSLFLVVEGTVEVRRRGRVVQLGPGELVGEIEVLSPGGGRMADIVALEPVRCLEVSSDAVFRALEHDPRAAVALLGVLAGRFRENA
jgi:flavin reductase (DIM6/NTAB) family NADH-FMN oxidoreductase RutF